MWFSSWLRYRTHFRSQVEILERLPGAQHAVFPLCPAAITSRKEPWPPSPGLVTVRFHGGTKQRVGSRA